MFWSKTGIVRWVASLMMISIMAAMLLNNAVYIHVHILPDGTLLAHAHPFDRGGENTSGQAHHHSNLDFQFYQDLQLLFLVALAGALLINLAAESSVRIQGIPVYRKICAAPLPGRAPPC